MSSREQELRDLKEKNIQNIMIKSMNNIKIPMNTRH